jgi:IS5 family transposase
MKGHVGADADSGLVRTLVGTAANAADVCQSEHLLHGKEEVVFADVRYIGADRREGLKGKPVRWHIAMKRGRLRAMAEGRLQELTEQAARLKAQLRACVGHPFHVQENLFGHRKVRHRSLAKEHRPGAHPVRPGEPGDRQEGVVGPRQPRCVLRAECH